LNEAIQDALAYRSDLKSLAINKDIAQLAFHMAEVKNRPTLSLLGNYRYTSPATGEDEWEKNWDISLVMSFPLFDSGRNEAFIKQRKSQFKQVELAIEQLEKMIELEVKKAFWDMQSAQEALLAQEKNIEQAEEVLSIAEGRYKSGTITQVEVLDANLALTRARLGCTKALYDYNLARASLMKAIGKEIE
jgi:outer membrane protein TolC